jgi:hypothetical protein
VSQAAEVAAAQAQRSEAARINAEDEKQRVHRESVQRQQAEALQRILRADPKDYRTVLNLPGAAGDIQSSQLTKAFRQQSLLVHPDKNAAPNAEEGFKKLQAACSALWGLNARRPKRRLHALLTHCLPSHAGSSRCLSQGRDGTCTLGVHGAASVLSAATATKKRGKCWRQHGRQCVRRLLFWWYIWWGLPLW